MWRTISKLYVFTRAMKIICHCHHLWRCDKCLKVIFCWKLDTVFSPFIVGILNYLSKNYRRKQQQQQKITQKRETYNVSTVCSKMITTMFSTKKKRGHMFLEPCSCNNKKKGWTTTKKKYNNDNIFVESSYMWRLILSVFTYIFFSSFVAF